MAGKKMTRRFSISVSPDEYDWIAKQAEWQHISISAYSRQRTLQGYHPKRAHK